MNVPLSLFSWTTSAKIPIISGLNVVGVIYPLQILVVDDVILIGFADFAYIKAE